MDEFREFKKILEEQRTIKNDLNRRTQILYDYLVVFRADLEKSNKIQENVKTVIETCLPDFISKLNEVVANLKPTKKTASSSRPTKKSSKRGKGNDDDSWEL
jgi:hypothetical protein